MARTVKVSDRLYEQAEEVSDEYECSMKEALSRIGQEAGYDV